MSEKVKKRGRIRAFFHKIKVKLFSKKKKKPKRTHTLALNRSVNDIKDGYTTLLK